MKRVTVAVCMLLLMAGLVHARDYELTKKAGEYTVRVMIDKNPPVSGKNNMSVGIKDGASQDVTDAKVAIDYGMPAMNYKTSAMLHGTRYQAVVDFSMSGPWAITVKITRAGKAQAVKLNVDVNLILPPIRGITPRNELTSGPENIQEGYRALAR